MRFFAFLSAFAITLGITSPGLGYRTLWADELETAERARSIVESGLPKIFDSAGNLSVSSAGKEIEEGLLHRYTSWLQFYVGAAGIEFGRRFGLASDTGVRLPFIILHAATSGLIAQGLVAGLSIGALPAIGIATLYGLGSVRLIHARTARYHALTDFLFIAAWIVFGKIRRRRRLSPGASASAGMTVLLGVILIALLHTQTLVGILGASIFSLLFFIEERVSKRTLLLALLVLVGVGTLFLLVRPWEQSAIWGAVAYRRGRGLKSWFEIDYALFFGIASFLFVSGFRELPHPADGWRKEAALFAAYLAVVFIGIRVLDLHPYSQVRYYIPVVGPLLFWPLALGGPTFAASARARTTFLLGFVLAFVVAEFSSQEMPPFQGLRIVAFDSSSGKKDQPLREAFTIIEKSGSDASGVLMEYVPQAVNWYLPRFRPALIPDPTTLSSLGKKNPSLPAMVAPEWNLTFQSRLGFWACDANCDYHRIGDPGSDDRYFVESKTLGKKIAFCVISRWETYQWNNAPFMEYLPSALTPEGDPREKLILARRCP